MEADFKPDAYTDVCSVCGRTHLLTRKCRAIRETYNCPDCLASLRERSQARCILDVLAPDALSITSAVSSGGLDHLKIFEPGTVGPFRKLFGRLPGYQQSDYYPEDKREEATARIPHQDLQELTFPESSFDLVFSSDIIEHVRLPIPMFKGIRKVLIPGGYHIFTVPMQHPLKPKTVSRVDTSGAVDKPIEPERYHGDGKGGKSLVYTDFGLDIVDILESAGFVTSLVVPETSSEIANSVITVVSKAV
jgi:SAM-dependent methyltransferase